ncbi:MAG: hypothetical protein H6697_02415 [Myxococcales bacterium]|nr:hypothetical protein [Myxococcales bacterium]
MPTAASTVASAPADGSSVEAGPLWGLTTYFNPSRYRTRLDNYRVFRERSRAQGLPLVTVELVPEGGEPELVEGADADVLLTPRSSAQLWHKERLLNLGLAALPSSCRYVAWLDADIVFEDDGWVAAACSALERHVVIQPFTNVVCLPKDGTPAQFPSSRIGWGLGRRILRGTTEGTYRVAFCAEHRVGATKLPGTTGYAWAARRELLDAHGFYDRCIIGGGDRELALAFVRASAQVPDSEVRIRHPRLRSHVSAWHDAVFADVRANVGALPGTVHHYWHGDSRNRRYADRHEILERFDFDPERDLEVDAEGCWRFAPTAAPLAEAVAGYLSSRREDG